MEDRLLPIVSIDFVAFIASITDGSSRFNVFFFIIAGVTTVLEDDAGVDDVDVDADVPIDDDPPSVVDAVVKSISSIRSKSGNSSSSFKTTGGRSSLAFGVDVVGAGVDGALFFFGASARRRLFLFAKRHDSFLTVVGVFEVVEVVEVTVVVNLPKGEEGWMTNESEWLTSTTRHNDIKAVVVFMVLKDIMI